MKIVSEEELVSIISQMRQQARSIVFTNGCFDILHAGHVRYLAAAKSCGAVLIV